MIFLCTLQELIAAQTKGFHFPVASAPVGLLLVHRDGTVYAYRNVCPHAGTPLNWLPDQFLDSEERYLQCATHGALFRIEDGYCEYGPCAGESLESVKIVLQGANIYWDGSDSTPSR